MTTGPGTADRLIRLGIHRKGAACLSVNKLADVDLDILGQLMASGHHHVTTELNQP